MQLQTLEAIIFDLDGTILDTTAELCHAVATAANRIVPELHLHPAQLLSKYPGLTGGPLEEYHDAIILPHLKEPQQQQDSTVKKKNVDDQKKNNTIEAAAAARHQASINTFIQYFIEAIDRAATPPLAFPDVEGALLDLHRKYPAIKFAIATTKPTPVAIQNLTILVPTVRSLFRHVQGTDNGISPKPAPDVLLRCVAALGTRNSEDDNDDIGGGVVDIRKTIYIGDTARDSAAAKAAGCLLSLTVRRPKKRKNNNNNDNGQTNTNTTKNLDKLGADILIEDFHGIEDALQRWNAPQ